MYCLLFFDDWHLHSRTNIDRHTGNARMIPEGTFRDPNADTAWGYPSVIQDPESGKWRCYYQGEVPEAGAYIVPLLAESDDGIHWEMPDLSDKIDIPDRKTPNQLFGTEKFREWCGMYPDPHTEGTDEWLKAMITYTSGPGLNLISYVATSGDGMSWTPHEDARWHPTGNDPGQFAFWNPHRQSYVLSFRPRVADRRIALSETKDWQTFTRPELALQADALDTPSALIYGMPVFPYEQMFVALPWMYHTDPIVHPDEKFQGLLTMYAGDDIARIMGKIDCHVAYSTNGWHFQRTVREPLIPNGPPGDPSSGCIYPSSMTEVGDTLRFYSSASKGEHAQFRADPSSGQGSILLHELRKDGFVYLEPPGGMGEFTTKWILWGGGEASINVDVPDGEIVVQVTDYFGNKIDGYTYADCEAFRGDSIGWTPAWKDGKNLAALAGQVIKLGVRVSNGRVYALRGDYRFITMPQARNYIQNGKEPELTPDY